MADFSSYQFEELQSTETFSMDSGAVDGKLSWSNLRFNQAFNSSATGLTHMKFSVELEEYMWQDDSDESCILIELSLSDANDGLASCEETGSEPHPMHLSRILQLLTEADNATMVGNGYVQQLPDQSCVAIDPQSSNTVNVDFELLCGSGNVRHSWCATTRGGNSDIAQVIRLVYSSFPSGWTLRHDPNIGVNSETDPMYGFSFSDDVSPGSVGVDTPWGIIASVAAVGVVILVLTVVGLAGTSLLLRRRSRGAAYEPLADS